MIQTAPDASTTLTALYNALPVAYWSGDPGDYDSFAQEVRDLLTPGDDWPNWSTDEEGGRWKVAPPFVILDARGNSVAYYEG